MSFINYSQDVTQEELNLNLPIDWVGLRNVKFPIQLNSKLKNSADISFLISLDNGKTRGIHMSRLYLILHDAFSKNSLSFSVMEKALMEGIKSQDGNSGSGKIRIQSQWPILRKALKSHFKGWREYPFFFEINYSKKSKTFEWIAGAEVLYSSTCPCSASLSAEIIKKDLMKKLPKKKTFNSSELLNLFSDKSWLTAVPHAQKSSAFFKMKLKKSALKNFSIIKGINSIEKALGTAVQTAVKREDEAEFARKNAQNFMFCEDASRRIALLFKDNKQILDYSICVQHYESLHPFTVESVICKGVKGGWTS